MKIGIMFSFYSEYIYLGVESYMNDMSEKGRKASHEKHGRHKLSHKEVQEIRDGHNLGIKRSILSNLYFVCHATIDNIINRKHWV